MAEKQRVGFIGVGLMGHGMAKNILEKGYPLTVMGHRNRAPVDDLVARGASEASTAKALAEQVDVVVMCVTSSVQVEDLVRGENGILQAARPGMIVIDASTSDPASTLALADELGRAGVTLLDAPMSRSPVQAEAGTLVVYIGGPEEKIAEVRGILDAYSEIVILAGPVGNGHKAKLCNNFIAMGYAALWAEAYATCAKAGVDQQVLYEVVAAAGLNCPNFQNFSKGVLHGDPSAHAFAIANCTKDLRYYTQFADALGQSTLLGDPVYGVYKIAMAKGYGDQFVPMLGDFMAELNAQTPQRLTKAAAAE
ncbi:MAG: NAD(P)-dependent oxidoreductase [Geminicoccaceae bacterium]